ncbi:hypothetical protein C7K43_01945 [Tetragenococcus koreensis]|nr:hypothetical protein C7K43_01945 [Tetragenococcus koreensis]
MEAMDYKNVAREILENVGGAENVEHLTNCATRLRFTLYDNDLINTEQLNKIDGVINVVKSGMQYQIIIGPNVGNVMMEIENMGISVKGVEQKKAAKHSRLDRFFDVISGIFTPIIPALTAAGMLKAVLVLLDFFNLLGATSSTYLFFEFVSDSAFYFLPIFVAISTAMKFKTNLFIAGILGAALIHPTFVEYVAKGDSVSLFGLDVPLVSYISGVIPSILAVWFMSYVERFADHVST